MKLCFINKHIDFTTYYLLFITIQDVQQEIAEEEGVWWSILRCMSPDGLIVLREFHRK